MANQKPIVGVTMGDPAGIGPEITAKSLSEPKIRDICRPVVIGDAGLLDKVIDEYGTLSGTRKISSVPEAEFDPKRQDVLDLDNVDLKELTRGESSVMSGEATWEDAKRAVELAQDNSLQGVVAGPHNKESVNLTGHHFEGYPHFLAQRTGTSPDRVFNLLVGEELRVTAATLHVPLSEVSEELSTEKVFGTIEVVQRALVRRFGIQDPTIAVAALNPHAGEGGLWGDEEETIIEPAIEKAASQGIDVVGPKPGDSLWGNYQSEDAEKYDAYVGMYHDQSHIAIKTLYFYETAGMIIGTPVLFATVCHGVAYDLIHKGGSANPKSLVETIKLVTRSAKNSA